ncbi:MAG: lysine--tRNA ligase [Clostridiaceae bacterium]|jgi:lysyl-tRNA synthetase class 2|nr:lysine--tRNA ligase [Clostridiaceae bacterium]
MSDIIENAAEMQDINEIMRVRREKLIELQASGADPFRIVRYDVTHRTTDIVSRFEAHEGKRVSVAGRLMSKRDMGKSSFCDIQDRDGRIQLYARINELGEEKYASFKKLDIGDLLGVTGTVFKTRMGEVSIKLDDYVLLAKSLRPLPEKFHGLRDTDTRYRQRCLDLIVNPEVKKTFITRSRIISAIRRYMDDHGFLEVETPILNTIAGGAAARPFITHHNTLDIDLYLRIAPELFLKRLIVGGLERVYELGRMFRNEGMGVKHNPEFTMMEVYQAYTDYHGMMELAEDLISTVAREVTGTMKVVYQGQEIDLTPPWKRITMQEAVLMYAGVDFSKIADDGEVRAVAREKGIQLEGSPTRGEVMSLLFEEFAEPNLIQPTFVIDYPVEISSLAKRKPDNPALTERFEIFITGREFGNAYSELNDPLDQRERFMEQLRKREAGDEEAVMMDEDFLTALEHGLPPTAGLGIGIDRLVMLLTDSYSIRDVLLFPTMKPKE